MGSVTRFLELARSVSKENGKGIFSQALEILRLRLGVGRLGISEYYDYRVWDDEIFSGSQKAEFAGYRAEHVIEEILVDDYSKILSLDKLTFDALMRAHGFAVPALLGVYSTQKRHNCSVPMWSDPTELANALRTSIAYPFYLKPSFGGFGQGNLLVQDYLHGGDAMRLGDGRTLRVDEFVSGLVNPANLGVMLQEVLRPHPDVMARCGPRISGVRIHVLLGPRGPKIYRAIWKIATGLNFVDNFFHGRSGNMVAAVDVPSGSIVRVVQGSGRDAVTNPRHPDTGAELLGFSLPGWQQISELVLDAATVFPGFLAQGWDVAVTDRGGVLLEVNMLGGVDIPQYSYARGMLDDEFMGFLRELGVAHLLRRRAGMPFAKGANGRRGARKVHWRY